MTLAVIIAGRSSCRIAFDEIRPAPVRSPPPASLRQAVRTRPGRPAGSVGPHGPSRHGCLERRRRACLRDSWSAGRLAARRRLARACPGAGRVGAPRPARGTTARCRRSASRGIGRTRADEAARGIAADLAGTRGDDPPAPPCGHDGLARRCRGLVAAAARAGRRHARQDAVDSIQTGRSGASNAQGASSRPGREGIEAVPSSRIRHAGSAPIESRGWNGWSSSTSRANDPQGSISPPVGKRPRVSFASGLNTKPHCASSPAQRRRSRPGVSWSASVPKNLRPMAG